MGTAGSSVGSGSAAALIGTELHPIFRQQAALISQLVDMNRRMNQFLRAIESTVAGPQRHLQ